MNSIALLWAYLRYRPLQTSLNLLLMSLGIALITVLLLLGSQLEQRLTRNATGIDMVVGAKGSPLQLILSSLYHIDIPTGNIPLTEVRTVLAHPLVKHGIPLALGDGYRGFRIVGTTVDYPQHYQAELAQGQWWQQPLEAVLGIDTAQQLGLTVGNQFVGSHGIDGSGAVHGTHAYRVVGVLARTETVLDRLILTSVETVWLVHDHGHEEAHENEDDHAHDEAHHEHDEAHEGDHAHDEAHHEPEEAHEDDQAHDEAQASYLTNSDPTAALTSLLIQYRSPLAAVTLPRYINSQSHLQAAVPAFEISRLLQLVGVGIETLKVLGGLLIVIAALGIFIALYYALQERRYDLALMRLLGASRGDLLRQLLLEGLLIALFGALFGIALGHTLTALIAFNVTQAAHFAFTGWLWLPVEWWLLGTAVLLGLVAALIPAIQAYRTDIAATLAD